MNKKVIAISVCIIAICTITLVSVYYTNKSKQPSYTGGSGAIAQGTLVLKGYEVASNDSSNIRLGNYFNTTQQANISNFIGALLYEKEQKSTYEGTVVEGSVEVDYKTSIIQFMVEIKDPAVAYKVTYNTLNDDMNVFSEQGQSLHPTLNPDGTPFRSFHSSSQLAQ